ncbi:hypothetical protein [Ramlibacter rhizophilus]|uniref:Uncharacterized protein n=1 Tax=Ramlibacter rhizophilus TaxID=1781167 RepID=A0A4Z0BQC6_9BURK|nr:hypothetical protein [Ramlibacter rhizophilus]TFZ01487.1 hypothetical protein EZ242_08940 [Ramlibacter rhizophilus]
MSENSHRLEQSRLAILEHIQRKQESPGMIRSALNKAAQAAGLSRSAGPSPSPEVRKANEPFEQAAAEARIEAADRAEALDYAGPGAESDPAARHAERAHRLFSGRFAGLGEAGRAYWQHHPARLVVELATPALSSYAQRRPFTFLAASAAVGAVIWVARPWRLISLSGLALAALRSPQLSSALIAAVYGPGEEEPTMPPPP